MTSRAPAIFVALAASACGGMHETAVAPENAETAGDVRGAGFTTVVDGRGAEEVGVATWYGDRFAGKRTASGERFDPGAMTAAHKTLPFGTIVDVTRLDTAATVRVRITDRGPFGGAERILDLSKEAARQLGMLRRGAARVRLRVVQ